MTAIGSFSDLSVLVNGDLVVDRYTWGDSQRISPEAPIVVLQASVEEVRLGGAASAACLGHHLGARTSLAGLVGRDSAGQILRQLVKDGDIDDGWIVTDDSRPTTTKHRFLGKAASRHPQQILRVDIESRESIGSDLERHVISAVQAEISQFNAIFISDYGKGVYTPRLLQQVINAGREAAIPVIIDPARTTHFGRYKGARVLKPNRIEAEQMRASFTGAPTRDIGSIDDAMHAARVACFELALDACLITLDQDGVVLAPSDGSAER